MNEADVVLGEHTRCATESGERYRASSEQHGLHETTAVQSIG
jgi:hypothetical protein